MRPLCFAGCERGTATDNKGEDKDGNDQSDSEDFDDVPIYLGDVMKPLQGEMRS
jgi:hypothetical protein